MRGSSALIVFARRPQAGMVKTRLARAIGDIAAATVYEFLLKRTLSIAEAVEFDERILAVATGTDVHYFEGILQNHRWRIEAQVQGDLGERMSAAFAVALEAHTHALLIGSDIADFEATDLLAAQQALVTSHQQAVLGPAADGGYWLIGLSTLLPEIFRNVPWSTDRVYRQTVSALRTHHYSVTEMAVRHDIDEVRDLPYLSFAAPS